MLIPYHTDAPIYHFPYATLGLIAVNVLTYVSMASNQFAGEEQWILIYGDGLHPVQWITSNFVHGGVMHLIGNMLFLWGFGIVVEGKIGWWKYLACYLGIGIVQNALEQTIMLGYSSLAPGSLGASAVLFGLLAMACVWAPKNEMSCVLLFLYIRIVKISILTFATFYIAWDLFVFWLVGFYISSAALHLMGAALGFALGFVFLKKKWVDCEGWDLISVWHDKPKGLPSDPAQEFSHAENQDLQTREKSHLDAAHQQIRTLLSGGKLQGALALYKKMSHVGGGVQLRQDELLAIIKSLHTQKQWSESIPFMLDFVRRFPDKSARVRLRLAQICVEHQRRPGKALSVLEKIPAGSLQGALEKTRRQLVAQAKKMQSEGELELEGDDW